ncbi:N-acetylmuramic acid 6-phosphate etherase [Scopulibacillus darangshiensis]|uniref:N-acetylmuramic acid 6-phosphate etherase n=1 Tax=Scopulibacillus darangshiensis TaxID=442528 RepID=A0A4R2P7Q3_9BACL|nr:N-acetylmuramic acid 6-phosphate etherase [Scopulibacillus darangshiensis]TCP30979.1 N-acetylmuramic acid 6-phosphate etherase [Scopulibacillus darangshiensis]
MSNNFLTLETEQVNQKSINIDTASTKEILEIINTEDCLVPLAVQKQLDNISQVVDATVDRIKSGGRIFYIGAGTSGRLGILDASECPPTFGVDPSLVQGIIAGGTEAIQSAVEGAEDSETLGRNAIYENNITEKDVVVGIAASGRTPFVLAAVNEAKKVGALTIGLSNNSLSELKKEADLDITPLVGPEVILGSTRMKSGTSQKLVLNMLTTAVMIKLGKVYGNLMVDMQSSNSKLADRSVRIIMHATDLDQKDAMNYLKMAEFNAKAAIVMAKTKTEKVIAEKLLASAEGSISKAIEGHLEKSPEDYPKSKE